MSDVTDSASNLASHTLTYLRRIDRRVDELTELFVRQQELITRLDRDMREGFSIVHRDIANLQRDVRELKSDMVLMENRVVTAVTGDHFVNARLDEHEDRLTALEQQRPPSV